MKWLKCDIMHPSFYVETGGGLVRVHSCNPTSDSERAGSYAENQITSSGSMHGN